MNNSLEEDLPIYRGVQTCYANHASLSWTRRRDTALWFANRFNRDGVVLEGRVKKKDIFAAFNGRDEFEIVVDSNLIEVVKP